MSDIFNALWRAYKPNKERIQYNCSTTSFEQGTLSLLKKSISLYKHYNLNFKDFEKMFEEVLKNMANSTANTKEIVAYNKRDRNDLKPKQAYVLEMEYQKTPFPKAHRIKWLALYLGLEETHISWWFAGRRERERLLLNYTTTIHSLTLPKCHVPRAICDIPRTSEEPKLKSKKDILVELLELDEIYSKEIIEQTNDLSFDQDIDLSFLVPQDNADDVTTNYIVDINLLRATLDLTHLNSSNSPEKCALENLENESNCWNESRRC